MYKTKEESMKEDEERPYKERLNYFRKYIIMINMPLLFTFLYEFLGTNLQRSRCQQPITFHNSTLNQGPYAISRRSLYECSRILLLVCVRKLLLTSYYQYDN